MPMDGPADYTRVFAKVFSTELEYIESRRKNLGLDPAPVANERERLQKELDNYKHLDPDDNPDIDKNAARIPVWPSSQSGLVGLTFSGGGIRSATFNLGLLQALAKQGILRF